VTHDGSLYQLQGTNLEPKPSRLPPVYMGGESPKAKEVIAAQSDAYVMHGDAPEVIAAKVADLSARREAAGRPPLQFGVSGFVICRDTEAQARAELDRILNVRSSPEAYASYQDFIAGSQLESQVSLEEYSVSNRGLRSGLVGTPDQITERLRGYADAGVDLMLLQFSPQREEMARFGRDVIRQWA
jgi:FMNH2-dependent dimethyl sulfone monooxygenase